MSILFVKSFCLNKSVEFEWIPLYKYMMQSHFIKMSLNPIKTPLRLKNPLRFIKHHYTHPIKSTLHCGTCYLPGVTCWCSSGALREGLGASTAEISINTAIFHIPLSTNIHYPLISITIMIYTKKYTHTSRNQIQSINIQSIIALSMKMDIILPSGYDLTVRHGSHHHFS